MLTQVSVSPGAPTNGRNSFDGGFDSWANVWPGDTIRYAMPQAVTVDQFYIRFGTYGEHPIENFTVRYSDTIDWTDPNWSTLASSFTVSNATAATYTQDITDALIRYVEFAVGTGTTNYNQLAEFMLLPPAAAPLSEVGRNLLADPYTQQNSSVSGTVWSNLKDPGNSSLLAADGYWQVNFGLPKTFDAITFSWYPGQGHNNINVYVSNDGSSWGSPIWTGNGNTFAEALFGRQSAQYIRITADLAGGGAMNDVHVFAAIPEPASLLLLALGGLVLWGRSRNLAER